jgi:hypothetical protein
LGSGRRSGGPNHDKSLSLNLSLYLFIIVPIFILFALYCILYYSKFLIQYNFYQRRKFAINPIHPPSRVGYLGNSYDKCCPIIISNKKSFS